MVASVTSAIDKSIDNNDNVEKKCRIIFFSLTNLNDQKVIWRLKCFHTSCIFTSWHRNPRGIWRLRCL